MGESAGLTLRKVGGVVMVVGSWRNAPEMAACTSCAAASMLRSSENCSVICVEPCELCEVMESIAGIVENCFSSGVATAAANVVGEAPGRLADTWIVGKSTFGRSATGSRRNAKAPNTRIPIMIRPVMTGRLMNGVEKLIAARASS
jgi:hypothetical protein